MIGPRVGGAIGLGWGESIASERGVRKWRQSASYRLDTRTNPVSFTTIM